MGRPVSRPPAGRDLFGGAVMAGALGLWIAEAAPGGIGGFLGFWLGVLFYLGLRVMVARMIRDALARERRR